MPDSKLSAVELWVVVFFLFLRAERMRTIKEFFFFSGDFLLGDLESSISSKFTLASVV